MQYSAGRRAVQRSTWGSVQCTASQAPAWRGSAASDSNARDTRRSSVGGGTGGADDAPGSPGTLRVTPTLGLGFRVRIRVTNVVCGWVAGSQPPSASRRGEADHSLGRG